MSDLFSSLLIFTIIKTILSTFFTVSKFYKILVKWALTEMECSVAGTTSLDREWQYNGQADVVTRRADNTMANRKLANRQTMICKTLHRKLKTEQHEPHKLNSGAPEG
jgi:hypothetical protein